jgi:type III secretion protein T
MNGLEQLGDAIVLFSLSLPRLIAAFMLLPLFSRQVLPGMVRNGVASSLALFLFPLLAAQAPAEALSLWATLGIVVKELFIGLLIGYGGAVVFWAVEATGFFIDNQRGSTMASSIDPLTGSQTSPMGILLTQSITVIFFVSGGFLLFLSALYHSYAAWPVFDFFPQLQPATTGYFLGLLDRLMALSVLLAAPVIIAMFLAEFSLGLISRFSPQLNVFFLAMPVKSAVGIFILAIYASLLLRFYGNELKQLTLHFKSLGALFQ